MSQSPQTSENCVVNYILRHHK